MDLHTLAPRLRAGQATQEELASVPREEVLAILRDGPSYRASECLLVREVGGDLGEREVEHVASTEAVDGMGDVIKVAGWDLRRMKGGSKVPVLYGHDAGGFSDSLPVGVLSKAKKDTLADGSKALVVRSRFNTEDDYGSDPAGARAEAVHRLVSRGLITGGSVGFIPKEVRWPDKEEREALGMGEYGVVFDKQELLEWSITPIPANHEAQKLRTAGRPILRAMVEGGKLSAAEAQRLEDELFSEERMAALLKPETKVHALGGIDNEVVSDDAQLPESLRRAAEDVADMESGGELTWGCVREALRDYPTLADCRARGETVAALRVADGVIVPIADSDEPRDLKEILPGLEDAALRELGEFITAELEGRASEAEPESCYTADNPLEREAEGSEPQDVKTLERKLEQIDGLLEEVRDELRSMRPESERADERETEPDGSAGTSDTAVTRENDPEGFQELLMLLSDQLNQRGA